MTEELHHNLIAGEWVEGEGVTDNINPSNTDDVVGRYARASKADTARAIAAAKAAAPAWARFNIHARYEILKKASDEILARKEELGRLLAREEGKTVAEGTMEAARAGQIFAFFAGEAVRVSGELLNGVRPNTEVLIEREPVGVVGLITPWNFPIAIPAWKIAPALAYGNTIVFKPADLVPGCGWALADILTRAGLPKGVFNLVMGKGSVVGQAILDSPDVNAISFTGSVETGRRVAKASAEHMRRFQLEMGGKSPLVVLDDADLKTAVECAANGAFFSTGQRCTASSRLVVTEGIHDKFVGGLIERIKSLNVDDALKEGTHIGPVVDKKQFEQDEMYIDIGRKEGAKLAWGGERLNRSTPGYYLQPALFTETKNDMRINREEIFGPVASVIRVKNYDEALQVANDTPFGLSSGICTTSLKYATDFRKNSAAGMVTINLPTAGVDYHAPFGGRKGSSYGPREQGRYAVEFYTSVKTTYQLAV
jgi:alpha-ketoglutaric semialdehyde dehydrogenase